MILTVIFLALLLFVPGEAFAWGMGVHLEIGSRLLSHADDFNPALRALLAAHPNDFLYGCLSADITVGKKFTHYLRNCHSWNMGKKVLASAKTDREKACAWGYLVHLAADCVAHSYFIPYKTVRTFNTTLHNHAYWEMRIEARLPPQIWTLAREVAAGDNRDNDRMLRAVLARTLFSFGTNKRIFNSIILLSQIERWQKGLQLVDNRSRWILEGDDLADYLETAYQAAYSFLAEGDASPYLKADPTGERALRAASALRRNLNHLWLEGKLSESAVEKQMLEVKNLFRAGITQPERLLELLSDR
ncbi:MAG: zinc dependent phospholipase C family protein [Desulfuromonadales bacterium]|nr:zinc dependent phospholipase C family protein [Desulfuromonadales bacterium]